MKAYVSKAPAKPSGGVRVEGLTQHPPGWIMLRIIPPSKNKSGSHFCEPPEKEPGNNLLSRCFALSSAASA
jgi:hypothetical protein